MIYVTMDNPEVDNYYNLEVAHFTLWSLRPRRKLPGLPYSSRAETMHHHNGRKINIYPCTPLLQLCITFLSSSLKAFQALSEFPLLRRQKLRDEES